MPSWYDFSHCYVGKSQLKTSAARFKLGCVRSIYRSLNLPQSALAWPRLYRSMFFTPLRCVILVSLRGLLLRVLRRGGFPVFERGAFGTLDSVK
jgi:hypothetical protein